MSAAAPESPARARWVLFAIEDGRYALPLASVERVVRAAQVTPLPQAPDAILGALDVAGDILPVFSLRRRLDLADRPLSATDQFIIARTAHRRVVLCVDAALALHDEPDEQPVDRASFAPGLAHIRGAFSMPDGLVLIHDLEQFLSDDENQELDAALRIAEKRHAR